MNRDRWQQIDGLFQAAVELAPERRAAFLDGACAGDQGLRSKVESLLLSDADEWNFIEEQALQLAAPFVADEQPQLVPGQRIAHYEIVSQIGKGGMGEVYLAKDERLQRRIALKLLTFDYPKDKARLRRFEREAHAASALNHPNILTIHELGLADGQQFIATEFVDGETLRQRMNRSPLGLPEALDIAIQTAGALAAAHEAGIVHRDIKPENIMLRPDGYVKVLDFGLAKLTETHEGLAKPPDVAEVDTSSSLLMGTVKYMSPEQAQGLRVDSRSDIFSLSVVLYEMVTGHVPFKGEAASDLIESILKDEPPSLAQYGPNMPEKIARIIGKGLGKRRETRYQTTTEFLADIKAFKEELDLELKLELSRPTALPAPSTSGEADRFPGSTQKIWKTSTTSIARSFAAIGEHKTTSALLLIALAIGAVSLAYLPLKRKGPSPGTWTTKAAMLRPRNGAAVAALNGELYVATGTNESGSTDSLDVYDPTTGKWRSRAPVPTARSLAGAAAVNGKLYVVGGCTNNSDCRIGTTNVLEAYDPLTDRWMSLAPMPTPRHAMAVGAIGGKLYVAGGRGSCPPCSNYDVLEVYDPATNAWDTTRPSMSTGRNSTGYAVTNEQLYVIGGSTSSGVTGAVEVYDPATNGWTSRTSMLTPRTSLGAEVVGGIIYAISGQTANPPYTTNVVEAYDPVSNEWTTKAPIPTARQYLQPVAINGTIYVMGSGGKRNQPISIVESYTAVCPGSTCLSALPGLIGWWPGDAHANDIAGSNNGTLQGSVSFEAGEVDQAFSFNGSSFVTMGSPAALNLSSNQVTIEGWIHPRAGGRAIYFGKTEYGLSDYLLVEGDGLYGLLRLSSSEQVVLGYSDFPSNRTLFVPPLNRWTDIALTYDGSMIKLYANGALVGQESENGNINGDAVPFNIGGRADDNGTGKFNGLIDEVKVFDRALSQEEIQGIFDAGSAGNCKPQGNCPSRSRR